MAEATATIPGGVAMQPQPTSSSNPNLPAGTAGTALAPAGVAPAPAPLMSVEGFRSVVAQPNVRRVLPFVSHAGCDRVVAHPVEHEHKRYANAVAWDV